MFKLFKFRPPIIIINEAEHTIPVPEPVIIKKTWWEQYAPVLYFSTATAQLIVLVTIAFIVTDMRQHSLNTQQAMLQQLRFSDSLYQQSAVTRFYDSVHMQQNNETRDSVTQRSFNTISTQLGAMELRQQQLLIQYKKSVSLFQAGSKE